MKKIAIIGCGISGLYFANLLQKNLEYDYTIFEKKPNLDYEDGYGIQLSVNSIKLLNKIGFSKISSYEIFNPKEINFFDAKTVKKICKIDITKFNYDKNYYTTLKRSNLIKFLLKNIPEEKIKFNIEVRDIEYLAKIKINLSNNHNEEFDYLVVADGVFSKTKSIILSEEKNIEFNNSVALRGNIKNYEKEDISLYLGKNFHFVIYPVNQNKEFNFISIIKKNLKNVEVSDASLFDDDNFLKSLTNEIYNKTSAQLQGKIKNIKSFPIFVSRSLKISSRKNTYFVGDALYAYPPSFAQGASQSIETSAEVFDEIKNNDNSYYDKRIKKIKLINLRSKLNHFIFHLSNPIIVFFRNIILKILVKNKKFLEIYLGKIYRN
ncbi:MAG: NAD(P)-binding protein [Candidatus Pelagibacter sp.]